MRAAVYCRISRDAEQEGLGVKRQEDDCRALVEARGWTLVEPPFVDNDISASSLSRKPRPAYDALLAAVRAGQVDAVVAYSNSRLTRRPAEWVELITLANQGALTIATVASGSHDLTTADGRAVALTVAAWDAAEAERTGERLRRKFLEKAQAGSVNQGLRAFGWADDKVSLHPDEAPLLRQAVEDVIDGVATREVARRWNAAGVTTVPRRPRGGGEPVGNAWTHTSVRQVLRNPRLAGWRVHLFRCRACDFEGASEAVSRHQRAAGHVGRDKAVARGADGAPVRGGWEPLLDQATFDTLQAALEGRRPRTRRGAQRYLLSGVARCGDCGSRMHGFRTREGGHAYACSSAEKGHSVTVAGVPTDDLVTALTAARLGGEDLSTDAASPAAWPGEARLAAIPGQIRELMSAFKAGQVSGAVAWPAIKELEDEQARLEGDRPPTAPRPPSVDAADLPGLDLDRRRAAVEALVEAVVVAKAARRGAPWTPERLTVVWRA